MVKHHPLLTVVLLASAGAAAAAQPGAPVGAGATAAPPPSPPISAVVAQLLPPAVETLTASREYPVVTTVRTSHAGWSEALGSANVPQEFEVVWHTDRGGEAVLESREAWTTGGEWQELGRWGKGTPERGKASFRLERPTVLRLRARGPKFPRSGVSSLQIQYHRHTVVVLRGEPGRVRRPVILAEGYDPLNAQDWNDPAWQDDPTFARLIAAGRERHDLDTWLLDWGDGGASLVQQADDFAELARRVNAWNGNKDQTVAAGISMGAVTLRYALASAAERQERLGVRKYLSINGPHQGAWTDPKLLQTLLKRVGVDPEKEPKAGSDAALLYRGLRSPAASELLIGGRAHDAFYTSLRQMGKGGYHPEIPRVAFSNGTLVKEGSELADFARGRSSVVHRIKVRPLWLPFWITMERTRQEFKYGGYPGELLPASLRQPVRGHTRFLSFFRFDFRAGWEQVPTFIATHSALDFPEELVAGDALRRYRYSRWRSSTFDRMYVARGRNLAHDETQVDWIDPRTGKAAPNGENAVLYEIAH